MHIVLDGRPIQDHFPGIGRYVYELARALPPVVPPWRITLLYQPGAKNNLFPLKELSGDIHLQQVNASPFSLRQQLVLPRLLHHLRPDIYHATYYMMPFHPGVPTVLTVYDDIPGRFPHYFSANKRFFIETAKQLALNSADYVIAISERTREDISRRYDVKPERFTVIPLAVDDRFHPQPEAAIAAIKARYHLPESYFLYVGSNKPHKNMLFLIKAWQQAASQVPDLPSLVISGPWDARYTAPKRLVVTNQLEENIRFTGPLPDEILPALYSSAVAFTFPSLYEGFGLPILEAMACGVPVICSRSTSLREVGGEAAHYAPADDPRAFSAAMIELWKSREYRELLRQKGLIRAARFTWQRTAADTVAVYRYLYQLTH